MTRLMTQPYTQSVFEEMLWLNWPLTHSLEGTWLQETQSRSKRALVDLCGLFVVRRTWRGSRERRGRLLCFTSSKIRQKVIDFPMTYPTPQNTPLQSQTAGVVNMHTISHTNTLLKPGTLPPTLARRPPPLPLSLPGCLSLSLAPPVSFMPLQSSCCPENGGSSIHIWAH